MFYRTHRPVIILVTLLSVIASGCGTGSSVSEISEQIAEAPSSQSGTTADSADDADSTAGTDGTDDTDRTADTDSTAGTDSGADADSTAGTDSGASADGQNPDDGQSAEEAGSSSIDDEVELDPGPDVAITGAPIADVSSLQLVLPDDLEGPMGDCSDVDEDALSEALGFEVDVVDQLTVGASLYRSCRFYDVAEDYIVLWAELAGGPEVDLFINPNVEVTGFATVDGLGDVAGYKTEDTILWGNLGAMRVQAQNATMYVTGTDIDDVPFTVEQLAAATEVLAEGIWTGDGRDSIGAFDRCQDVTIAELAGSPLGEFAASEFDNRWSCSAQAESGDRIQFSVGQWLRAELNVDWVNDYAREYTISRTSWMEDSDLDPRFTRGLLVENRLTSRNMGVGEVSATQAFFVSEGLFIEVSVLGDAASNGSVSGADLQDIALTVIYGDNGDIIRYHEDYEHLQLHQCGNFRGRNGAVTVDCSEPHQFQNYGYIPPYGDADDPYPGWEVLSASCYGAFEEYVGVPIWAVPFGGESWYPEEADWDRDPSLRWVDCLIFFDDELSVPLPEVDFGQAVGDRLPWTLITAETCVLDFSYIDQFAVYPSDCSADTIDILGLVDSADGDVWEQCEELADGYESPTGASEIWIESSPILEARGLTKSICLLE